MSFFFVFQAVSLFKTIMPAYNGLFKDIEERVVEGCNEHLAMRAPVNAGSILRTKLIGKKIRSLTKRCLIIFKNRLCQSCPNHDLWVVAGVYIFTVMYVTHSYFKTYKYVLLFFQVVTLHMWQVIPIHGQILTFL